MGHRQQAWRHGRVAHQCLEGLCAEPALGPHAYGSGARTGARQRQSAWACMQPSWAEQCSGLLSVWEREYAAASRKSWHHRSPRQSARDRSYMERRR